MAKALPIEHTNSIFVRCDKDRVDVMKALIFGSAGKKFKLKFIKFFIFIKFNFKKN